MKTNQLTHTHTQIERQTHMNQSVIELPWRIIIFVISKRNTYQRMCKVVGFSVLFVRKKNTSNHPISQSVNKYNVKSNNIANWLRYDNNKQQQPLNLLLYDTKLFYSLINPNKWPEYNILEHYTYKCTVQTTSL